MNVDIAARAPSSVPTAAAQSRRADRLDTAGRVVAGVIVLGWVAILGTILAHPVFVTHDSLIDYAHAWWIDDQLRSGHGIPWHMPVLGHGDALTFPYGVLPWTFAGLVWPVFGQWGVTLALVLGVAGLIAATFWAFPHVRSPWWAAVVLTNPILVLAPLSGQLPFLWAMALFVAGIGAWRRGHRVAAVLLTGVGQLCHLAVVGPIVAIVVLARLRTEPDRRGLLGCWALSVLIAAPAIWPVVSSPVFSDSSLLTKAGQFVGTVSIRLLVLTGPVLALIFARNRRRWVPVALVGLMLALNVAVLAPLDAGFSWAALRRPEDPTMARFAATPEFVPGATYRVLRSSDGKVGMYQLLRAGGRLDSEFFPESIWYGNFADEQAYGRFLAERKVDDVLVFRHLAPTNATNEGVLLARMAGRPCKDDTVGVRLVATHADFDHYSIDRSCLPPRDGAGR